MVQWNTLLLENKQHTLNPLPTFSFWTRTTDKTETLATIFSPLVLLHYTTILLPPPPSLER